VTHDFPHASVLEGVRFTARIGVPRPGRVQVMARCTNTAGETQPMEANWNPGGYMRNCVEPVTVALT
jgi:hypothetical protein